MARYIDADKLLDEVVKMRDIYIERFLSEKDAREKVYESIRLSVAQGFVEMIHDAPHIDFKLLEGQEWQGTLTQIN